MDTDSWFVLKSTLFCTVVGYVVYKLVTVVHNWRTYARIFDQCPGEKDFHWLYGNLHTYPGPNEKGIKFDIDVMKTRPRFSRVWASPFVPVLLLYHPDLIRMVLKSSAPKPRGGLMLSVYEMGLGWLGEGLLIANGARWARSRRLLTPAFHFDILRPYVDVKNQAADVLLAKLRPCAEKEESFEVFQHVSLCLFDVLLQCAFAHESHCQTTGEADPYVESVNQLVALWSSRSLKNDAYIQNVNQLVELWVRRSLLFMAYWSRCPNGENSFGSETRDNKMTSLNSSKPWMFIEWLYRLSPEGRQWYKLCDQVHSMSEELINKRRKILEANQDTTAQEEEEEKETHGKKRLLCFVDILLSAKDEDGKGMTPLEIRNEADTFLFEGFDTTTSALSWTLYSMARWPEHQTRVQEEVDAILKERQSDHILWEDLNSLPYTTACIKEAMRNYSTVPFIERETTEPLNIDGHVIPAGTFIAIQLWCLHHNPTVWDRPHDFLPERFLGDNITRMDPFQFVPFSAGPRNCIGQNFAMHELKIMVARICHRFTLRLDPDHEVLRAPLATFKAEKGIKLLATPRQQ